jgi:hypothetical protein
VFTFREIFCLSGLICFKVVQGWQQKLLLFPPLVFYTNTLGGNGHILLWFYAIFLFDLAVGITLAVRMKEFRSRKLEQWVLKCLIYSLCIYMVGVVDRSFVLALRGFQIPLLDLIVAGLLATEVNSTFKKLQILTGKVPPLLMSVSGKMEDKAGAMLDKRLKGEAEGEGK